MLRCGECGGRLSRQPKPSERYDYACKNPGCGKVAGSGIEIDRILTEKVHAHYAKLQIKVKPAKWAKADELKDYEADKANLLTQFKENPDMGAYIWPQIRELDKSIKELQKERIKHTQEQAKPQQTNLKERWPDMTTDQRRAVFESTFEVVVLNRATRPSNRFDPNRLDPVMKELSLEVLRSLVQKQFALAA